MYSNFVLNFDFIKSWRLRNLYYSPAIERNTILTLSLITEIRQLAALMMYAAFYIFLFCDFVCRTCSNACQVMRLACKSCFENSHYILFSNRIGVMVDLLIMRLSVS